MTPRRRRVPTGAYRAADSWKILVESAKNRQTVTYGELSDSLGRSVVRGIGKILDHAGWYCRDKDLPPLTSIVVNKKTKRPGPGWEIITPNVDLQVAQEKVFAYDWSGISPPTPEELAEAYRTGRQSLGQTTD